MSSPNCIVLGENVGCKNSAYHPTIWGDYFIKHTHESLPYKAQMKVLSKYYFEEAKWCSEKYVPTVEEHLCATKVTSGNYMLACASFVGMAEVATKEAFEWVTSYPKILQASALICQIMDDITSHEIPEMKETSKRLKKEIVDMLQKRNDLVKTMDWIDAIQLLGLGYHFENEINEALNWIYDADFNNYDDLYVVALRFRLLRQHGYHISPDIFNKFRNEEGTFKSNAKGLLSLYNAAYLGIHGEVILDEAIHSTKHTLSSLLNELEEPLVLQVSLALKSPFHRTPRQHLARNYISIYEKDATQNDVIMEFAKLDFNLLLYLHRQELLIISRWWKDLGLIESLSYARDRMVECFYWTIAVFYEPQYSRARLILAKAFALASIMDDTYDNYSTIDESKLLNDAIQRWEYNAIDQLPAYMKGYYMELINNLEELKKELEPEEKFRVSFLMDQMKVLSKYNFEEAKWCAEKYVPTVEEHLCVTKVTSGYYMLACASFVGMGGVATKEAFEWVTSYPKILQASALICRIMDDITSHEIEQERGSGASTVECYMKEHNTNEDEACKKLQVLVEEAWKDLNKECLNSTIVPTPLLDRIVNLARMLEDTHKQIDAYTNPNTTMKEKINLLFVEPILI